MAEGNARGVAPVAAPWEIDPRRRAIWRWQLVLAFAIVATAAVVALLKPDSFAEPMFVASLVILIAATLVAVVLPWHRMPRWAPFALPLIDIVGIGVLGASGEIGFGFLWAIPIAWTATYYSAPWLVCAICTVALVVLLPGLPSAYTSEDALRLFVVLIALVFTGTTILIGTGRTRATNRLLQRQSLQLEEALARAAQEERRRDQVFDSLQSGIAQLGSDGVIRSANLAFRRMFGIESLTPHYPARSVEYRSRRGEPVPPEAAVLTRAARGEPLERERVWLFDADGRWRQLEVTAHQRPDVTVVVADDVTAVAEADRERQSLVRVMSHELRSPLTAVLGHAELVLERTDLPAAARRQLRVVRGAAERMEQLVGRILQDPGVRFPEADTLVEVSRIVEASVDAFTPAAFASGVTIDLRAEGEPAVMGDAFRLRQVVDNIVGNAIKYTPRGGRVAIEVGAADDAVTIRVADTGIGISETDLPQVFDEHFRAASARERGLPGTGLGMGISRAIVADHGGSIDIRSRLDHGTAVTIRLPRANREKP